MNKSNEKEIAMIKLMLLVGTILIAIIIIDSNVKAKAWDTFKRKYDCKVVEEMSGSITPGISLGSGNVVMTVTPDKECWKCNDGKKYWRDK